MNAQAGIVVALCLFGMLQVQVLAAEPEPLVASAGPDRTIVSGGSATLEGSASGGQPPYSYNWSPTAGLSDPNVAEPTASPPETTTYTLTATDDADATASDQSVVFVHRVHNVTQDLWYLTVQDAVVDANDLDEIVLTPGVYAGQGNRDIDNLGKALTIRSLDPNDPNVVAATVIDCQGEPSDPHDGLVLQDTGSAGYPVIDGLTIRNARAGDGIVCNVFCDATISKCAIEDNAGTGVCCVAWSSPTIHGCTICRNGNSGIRLEFENHTTVSKCLIACNSAESGAGIFCYESWPIIRNTILSGNRATTNGGGIWWEDSGITMANCTFIQNAADVGGAVYGSQGNYYDDSVIINTVLWDNAASAGPQIALGELAHAFHHDTLTVSWSDVQGGESGAYVSGSTWTLVWDIKNIDADPLFVDPNGPDGDPNASEDNDYHLSPTSPCINAGDPNGAYTGQTDIDGDPRVVPVGGLVDMGADEVSTLIVVIRRHRNYGTISVEPLLARYEPNTTVTLFAQVTEPGWYWDGWQEGVDPNDKYTNPLVITVGSSPTVIETGFNCGSGVGLALPLMLGVLGVCMVGRSVVRRRRL